ncbi:uncharacterized protein [Dysidea avara]|uniref:uncharacterized protein n=1 Tax=Dysidea avara TaxID=196820 RepID=UPI00331699FB
MAGIPREDVPLVLVTGASGYIATHVIQQLLSSGNYRVRGTIRSLKNEERVKALKELVPGAKYSLELCEAELEDKESWVLAVKGCTYVFHIAAPVPPVIPRDPDEMSRPAIQGTLNVLSACAGSGTVKKVILTSSTMAISCGLAGHPDRENHIYTEEDFSIPEVCPPYERSKVLAEKAAWKFVDELPEKKFDLVVMNPGLTFGPIIVRSCGASVDFVRAMLAGDVPGAVDITMMVIDVRDVARAHIIAMEKPECIGKRYILVAENNVHFRTVAEWIQDEFDPQGYKIGTMRIPKFVAWIISKFNTSMRFIYPGIGKRLTLVNDRMIDELGIKPTPIRQSVIDTGYSLIEFGFVQKTDKYQGSSAT